MYPSIFICIFFVKNVWILYLNVPVSVWPHKNCIPEILATPQLLRVALHITSWVIYLDPSFQCWAAIFQRIYVTPILQGLFFCSCPLSLGWFAIIHHRLRVLKRCFCSCFCHLFFLIRFITGGDIDNLENPRPGVDMNRLACWRYPEHEHGDHWKITSFFIGNKEMASPDWLDFFHCQWLVFDGGLTWIMIGTCWSH